MINKRLIKAVPDATSHIAKNVICQIVGLIANITMMICISLFLSDLITSGTVPQNVIMYAIIIGLCIVIKVAMIYIASNQSYLASKSVKSILRSRIYEKVIKLGSKYTKKISSAELLQMSVEGVEQLETYFGNFLPQFFYSMISPLILFFVVSFINFKIAIVLFVCVPLIPISIVLVQKFAKKLLAKYWGEYLGLGDNFLENLQGLNTLKIYSSDEYKHEAMNKQAERFRVVTMKVLSMQLNSIIIMDIVAYGGAALGIIFSILEFQNSSISIVGLFTIIMLSADFFLPLRLLGSFFHIAMNGIAASKNIFNLLDLQEDDEKLNNLTDMDIEMSELNFAYDDKSVLCDIDMKIKKTSFVSIVGKSGCGKSTISGILSGVNEGYRGTVKIGGVELSSISRASLSKSITLVSANSYIFKGTVKENLKMANSVASDEMLWEVLDKVNLSDFLRGENGLSTVLLEKGSNFSGGQCQRLAIARALLHDSEIYIFDEATSNIDVDSENDIMAAIRELTKTKTVILISHRLANVVHSDYIYVLRESKVVESGTHEQLLINKNYYSELWSTQQKLEQMEEVL